MEDYIEGKDYKSLHLEWIKANRGFRPKRGVMTMYSSYLEEMTALYAETIKYQRTAYTYLKDDYLWSKRSRTINDEIAVMFGDKPVNNNPYYFVTFNWSPDFSNFNQNKIIQGLERLMQKSWIDTFHGVFEYHGVEKNHPHLMCLIQVNKHKTLGKFRDKIFESSLASTLKRNFIDIKEGKPHHHDYIELDKATAKQECLDKDVIWRQERGLAPFYKK